MKIKTIEVYSFDELSDEAKKRAINEHREFLATMDFWDGENKDTLTEFCKLFPVSIGRNGFSFHGEELEGQKLATHLWNHYKHKIYKAKQYWICDGRPNCVGANSKHRDSKIFLDELGCPLTGFYLDNEILGPIFDFMRKPNKNTLFSDLMDECYQAWERTIEKDREYQLSDENVIGGIKANDYTFTIDGKLENL